MHRNKCFNYVVILYLSLLMFFVIVKMLGKLVLVDVVYLLTLVSCIFKVLLVVRENGSGGF